jgi:hypothetical protein
MMKYQSYAVTAQRIEPNDSREDFPTPPWATRALIEHVIGKLGLGSMSCLEPACGAGHMAKALKEYFGDRCTDAFSDGYAPVRDWREGASQFWQEQCFLKALADTTRYMQPHRQRSLRSSSSGCQ